MAVKICNKHNCMKQQTQLYDNSRHQSFLIWNFPEFWTFLCAFTGKTHWKFKMITTNFDANIRFQMHFTIVVWIAHHKLERKTPFNSSNWVKTNFRYSEFNYKRTGWLVYDFVWFSFKLSGKLIKTLSIEDYYTFGGIELKQKTLPTVCKLRLQINQLTFEQQWI